MAHSRRAALRSVLEGQPDFEVVGEAEDGLRALALAGALGPDVILMDARLQLCDGVTVTAILKERLSFLHVLIIGNGGSPNLLAEALEAGAGGVITETTTDEELVEAVRVVHAGEVFVPRRLLGPLLRHLATGQRARQEGVRRLTLLTEREREVLALLSEGRDNDSMARYLAISPNTVRTHVRRVLAKLGFHSRLEAASFVLRGQIEPLVERTGQAVSSLVASKPLGSHGPMIRLPDPVTLD